MSRRRGPSVTTLDARYSVIGDSYTKAQSDSRFVRLNLATSASQVINGSVEVVSAQDGLNSFIVRCDDATAYSIAGVTNQLGTKGLYYFVGNTLSGDEASYLEAGNSPAFFGTADGERIGRYVIGNALAETFVLYDLLGYDLVSHGHVYAIFPVGSDTLAVIDDFGGDRIIVIGNRNTAPTSSYASGAILYAEGGRLKVRQSNGTVGFVQLGA